MTLADILKLLLMLSIVAMVFALALRAKASDAFYFVTHWQLGLRAFVSMYVVVPAVAIAMARLLDLNPAVKVAMVAIAFSPLPPILPGKQMKAGGRACYVTGLLVGATVVSIVVTPLGLSLAGRFFGIDAGISAKQVATTLGITILMPLLGGLGGAAFLGDSAAATISRVLSKVATVTLVVAALVLLVKMTPAMIDVLGQGTLLALLVMSVAGLAAGYILAGSDRGDKVTLSLASATRHPGIALAIALQNFSATELAPAAIVLGLLVSLVISVPYMQLMKRQAITGQV
ncbi:hypothetical protein WBP07_26510 [Novosphingobium sp. BL-8A]|uniref:hypothetical protein n=1 Tax=Novosphingobium sp. BL-8A TaxID=3127639 RepID=UPI003757B93A